MIRFVPKDRVDERRKRGRTDLLVGRNRGDYTEGGPGDDTKFHGANARVRSRVRNERGGYKDTDKATAAQQRQEAHQKRRGVPTKQRSSTELDRIGVAILEGLDILIEGEVKKRNKALKRERMARIGKEASVNSGGRMTDREENAAKKGGRGGGVEAQRRGVTASYVAAGRQKPSSPKDLDSPGARTVVGNYASAARRAGKKRDARTAITYARFLPKPKLP